MSQSNQQSTLGKVIVLTETLEKPLRDHRKYRVIKLSNGLEVVLAHDPEADQASAALDVNVGSLSDDKDLPGIAHALEHVRTSGLVNL